MHQTIDHRALASLSLAALLAATAACGTPRTAAATQPTPAAFDATMSDDKALAAVDSMVQTLGGTAVWDQTKELRWESKYYTGGNIEAWLKHSWDKWNGRHRYERPNMETYAEAQTSGRPEATQWYVAMYDLFDRQGSPTATYAGTSLDAPGVKGFVEEAYEKWRQDSYLLTMLYKLRDPGVTLSYVGEVQNIQGLCMDGCIEIKVAFAPEVGTDIWYVDIDKQSNLPQLIGKQVGNAGRIVFGIAEWADAGGLKLPGKLQVLGANQEITFENISARTSPENTLYVPAETRY